MNGKTPNKEEADWLSLVSQVGCIICINYLDMPDLLGDGHCEIHHINGCDNHLETIGLCARHHRIGDTAKVPRWLALHVDGIPAWESFYTTQEELLLVQEANNAVIRGMTV